MSRSTGNPLWRWFMGFFAAMFAIALLPRTVVFVTRRMAGKIVAEVLAVLLLSFLAERFQAPPTRKKVSGAA